MTLEELVKQLTLVYGQGLRCVALYGSAARGEGEHVAKRSDLNVLVIVDSITMEHLRKESAVARSWRESGNPPPLTLTLSEWRGSGDIFPMEYADILAYHRVLAGSLPSDGMRVDRGHLRLQLEHEAMSKLLRLRHAVLSAGGDGRTLSDIVSESASSMMVLLRSALRLVGEEPPADSAALLDRVEQRVGLGPDTVDVFRRVRRHARGESPVPRAELQGLVEGYLAAVAALVEFVNRFEG
jgi:hypothetical protein